MEVLEVTKYYREPAGESFPQLEEEVLRRWTERDIPRKKREMMSGGTPLVFCEGPPTAKSMPHVGHALSRAVKDAFLRYLSMNGRRIVPYIAGWDCHGLPVEIEVEEALGIRSRSEVESIGVGEFNDRCRASVLRYKGEWERMSQRIGYWIDYADAYMTMSNEYIESVWWSLKELHGRGLLEKKRQVVPYCTRCGTTLSTHEVALGYREKEDRYVVVKVDVEGLDAKLLAYTSSPWTMLANSLLSVDEGRDYVIVAYKGERLVVSEERMAAVVPDGEVVSKIKGLDLVSRRYTPIFSGAPAGERSFTIIHFDDVPRGEGTGILNISPPYGSIDYDIALSHGIDVVDKVDDAGRFLPGVPEFGGRPVQEVDADVTQSLDARGVLFKWALFKHSYPFCWRCGSPLIHRPQDAWLVLASTARERMAALNEDVRWVPEDFKEGRFGNFIRDARDWAIGRTRYWGTPLPIWRCTDGHSVCVGSIEELKSLATTAVPEGIDLHRPFIDSIVLRCPECGGDMRREEHVIDCWYDSGCAPFAQYHYPFENMAEFDDHRSVDFISETVDQTRGWFYTQHVLGTLLFDQPAFRSVLVMGHVLDDKGRKMCKGLGNIIYSDEAFSSVGADASRLYLLGSPVWEPVEFSMENVRKTMVGPLTTLLNVYAFFATNSNRFNYRGEQGPTITHDLDRWILSRLNSTVVDARSGFDSLELHLAVDAIVGFIEDLSNWYLRRSRRRFWRDNDPEDRFSAYSTLNECLTTLSKMMSPITPFLSEWMYLSLKGPMESIHLESYPVADMGAVNESLEAHMRLVEKSVEAGRLARQKAGIKLRQPLDRVVIAAGKDGMWILRRYEKMLSEELNVKHVDCIESREHMVAYNLSPNLKTLGPRLKASAAEVSSLMAKVDGSELVRHLSAAGRIRLGGFDLFEEDVVVTEREREGFSHAEVGGVHVFVETAIPKKLMLEGLSREIVRRAQHMRKELGLEFGEPVRIEYSGHPDIEAAISAYDDHIRQETNATSLVKSDAPESGRRWTVNRMPLVLSVKRV